MSKPDTNQASEARKALKLAILSLGHSEVATRPSSIEDAEKSFESAVQYISDFIRTEKLKLLAEIREQVVGEDEPHHDPDRITQNAQRQRNLLRAEQMSNLTKLEAEL